MRSTAVNSLLSCLNVLAASLTVGSLGGGAFAAPYVAVVNGSEVKIRTGGSQNHFAFASVKMGQRIIVDRDQNGWCRIHIPRWIPVYVHKDYVIDKGDRGVVKAGQLNIRVVPQRAHEEVGSLAAGSEVQILGREGDWLKIVPPAGAFAYISQRYTAKDRELSALDVPRELAHLTGEPGPRPVADSRRPSPGTDSVRGGESSATTPSGFTTPALRRAELVLQRVASLEPLARDYGVAKKVYEEVKSTSEDRTEIALAEQALHKISLLEQNQAILREAQEKIHEVERKNHETDDRVRQARFSSLSTRPADSDPYLARGWLTGLGRYSGHPGTHRLMKGSQVLYFLQSEDGKTIPLDAFLYKRVGVKGVARELEPKFGANLIVVSEIVVLSDH